LYPATPAVAVLGESSGGFRPNVGRARPLGRWLFLEADALAFVQLIEAALDGTPMKKPFLTTVVANETETPVSDKSLDRAARHPSLLGHTDAQYLPYQFPFHLKLVDFGRISS
jgi:hypothetical protein